MLRKREDPKAKNAVSEEQNGIGSERMVYLVCICPPQNQAVANVFETLRAFRFYNQIYNKTFFVKTLGA